VIFAPWQSIVGLDFVQALLLLLQMVRVYVILYIERQGWQDSLCSGWANYEKYHNANQCLLKMTVQCCHAVLQLSRLILLL